MGVLTDSGVIPPAVTSFFDRKLLKRALPNLVYMRMAQRRPLSMRNGFTIIFRRFERLLPLPMAPLVEGVTPTGQQLSKTDVPATIVQHGNFVELTDFVKATVESPLLNETSVLLAEQSAQTLDALMRDEANGGATVIFRGGNVSLRTSLANRTHMLDTALLDRVMRALEQNNASYFTSMIDAAVKYSTFPIRPAFWCVAHPDIVFTAQELPGFISVEQYAGRGQVMEAEVGAYKNMRFLMSTQAGGASGGGGPIANAGGAIGGADVQSTGQTDADVYLSNVFATDAIGAIPLDGMSLQNIIKPVGSAGAADPMDQRGTTAWKYTGTRKVLNPNFEARIETTAGKLQP